MSSIRRVRLRKTNAAMRPAAASAAGIAVHQKNSSAGADAR
jgi:hypothetical protein